MDILIVKPSSLGDIIHVFPALELLRRRYPEARTDWLVRPEFAEILAYSPLPIRRKILFERKKLARVRTFPGTFCRLVRELRGERYDLVIDFQGLFRSGFFAWTATRRCPVAGFAHPRERSALFFYGKKFAVPEEMHAIERNVALVNSLLHTSDAVPEYAWPAHPEFGGAPVPAGKTAIAIVPGARWASKQFPESLFADVIRHLREACPERFVFRIIGSAGEQAAQTRIMALAGNAAGDIEPLAGRTGLPEMVETLRTCGAVLCNDSGPMHAAAALQLPVVALFGPTLPGLTGPYGRRCRVVRAEGVDCLGCMRRECGRFVPPRCHDLAADRIARMILDGLEGRFLPESGLTGSGNEAIL